MKVVLLDLTFMKSLKLFAMCFLLVIAVLSCMNELGYSDVLFIFNSFI